METMLLLRITLSSAQVSTLKDHSSKYALLSPPHLRNGPSLGHRVWCSFLVKLPANTAFPQTGRIAHQPPLAAVRLV